MNLKLGTQVKDWIFTEHADSAHFADWPVQAGLILFSPDRRLRLDGYQEQALDPLVLQQCQNWLTRVLPAGVLNIFDPNEEQWLLVAPFSYHQTREMAERLRWAIAAQKLLKLGNKVLTCSFGVGFYEQHTAIVPALQELETLLLQAKLLGPDGLVTSLRQPRHL